MPHGAPYIATYNHGDRRSARLAAVPVFPDCSAEFALRNEEHERREHVVVTLGHDDGSHVARRASDATVVRAADVDRHGGVGRRGRSRLPGKCQRRAVPVLAVRHRCGSPRRSAALVHEHARIHRRIAARQSRRDDRNLTRSLRRVAGEAERPTCRVTHRRAE